MSKSGKILAFIAIIVVLFFSATTIGRTVWNTYWHDVEKADDNTSYENRKKVEDTARAYISSYNADVVNGIILCRKMAKKNVVFPTYFFVSLIHDIIYLC